jgi:long-chain fatty acid transport protein
MKRVLIALLFIGLMSPVVVLAGGIVTNSNQSAAYVRMLARDASTSIDAVYFNPAGLTKLEDGFHLSLSNQSIFQKKTIENKFPLLNDGKFIGDVAAPLFPDFYAVYKKNKLALAFGLTPNAGGGSAKYNTGLPSFEIPVSVIPASLSSNGIVTNNYSADIHFEGTSVFWGAQVNASYAVNDMLSLSVGARAIFAKNTYNGYLKNIMIDPNQPAFNQGGRVYAGTLMPASQFFTDAATTLNGWSSGASAFVTGLQPIVSGGGGATLLSNGTSVGLTGTQVAQIQGLLGAAGLTPTQIGAINIATAQGTLNAAAPVFAGKATAMTANAAATADKNVDADQTGTGYTPILGANLTFGKLNVGIRYEFKTKLTLTNKTKVDGTGMFVDGAKIRSDIPAILSVGLGYKAMEKMRLSAGMHYYFDKDATMESAPGVKKVIDGNLYEIALGGEYDITDKVLISAGYLYAKTGVGQAYQTDLSHSLTSNTVGFGGGIKVTEKMLLNLGMLYTMYTSDSKDIAYTSYGVPSAKETYNRTNIVFSFGVDYRF